MNHKGFSQIVLIVIAGVVLVVAGGSFWHKQSARQNEFSPGNEEEKYKPPTQSPSYAPTTAGLNIVKGERVDNYGCSGSGPVTFGTSPMRPEDIGTILPYGGMVGAHVAP